MKDKVFQWIDQNKDCFIEMGDQIFDHPEWGLSLIHIWSNVIKDEVMVDVDILAGFIKRLGGNVGAEYANPAGQGRIAIR